MKSFSSSDIGIATVLQTIGYKFQGLDRSNPNQFNFIFEVDDGFDEVLSTHYRNELKLSSLALLSNFRVFKNMVHHN